VTYVLVYFLLLLAVGLAGDDRTRQRGLYRLSIIALFIYVAFRYEVGCDWNGYLIIYDAQSLGTYESAFSQRESLFAAANVFLHQLGLDYPYINVMSSAVYFAGFHMLARRQPNPLSMLALSFPLLVLHLAMSAIRQATAVGILCVAFNAFNDRRPVLFAGLVLLAGVGFHTSALVFLSLTPFVIGELSRRNIAIGMLVGLPGLYYLASGEQFTVYYDRYVGTGTDAFGAPFRTAFLTMTGALFLLAMKDRWRRYYPADFKLTWMSAMIMLVLFPLAFVSSVIADRIAYYLMPVQIVILARFSRLNKGVLPPFVLSMPFVASGIVLIGWTALSALFAGCYVPYTSWLVVR
jgi:hypothetical protein